MSELGEQLTECVMSSGLNDYDQRSAIGMARSWVDKREPIRWNPDQIQCEKRDDLAKALVALMAENPAEDEDYIEALQDARREVNRPFQSEAMLGFQAGRKSLVKPGERKKARADAV